MLCYRTVNRHVCWFNRLFQNGLHSLPRRQHFHPTATMNCLSLLTSFNSGISAHSRLSSRIWKCFSTESSPQESNQGKQLKNEEMETTEPNPVKVLYRFPNVKQMRTITNLKIYQTALCAVVVPYVYSAYQKGIVSLEDFASSVVLLTVATLMLYTISMLTQRVICILKYNEDTKEVHISHLTFWGRRRDVTLNLENIVPLSDTEEGEKVYDAYVKLDTYDKSEKFYLFHKFSTNEEKEEIMRIFR